MIDGLNWTAMSFVMSALAMLVSAGAWVYIHVARRHAATDDQIGGLDQRLTRVETAIEALPTGSAWGSMREDIAGMRGELRAVSSEIRGLGAGLKRVENHVNMLMDNELRGQRDGT